MQFKASSTTSPPKISQRGTRGIQSLIFLASFILSALLGLGSLSVSRVLDVRSKLPPGGSALLPYFLSTQGFLTLLPLDILLVAYACSVILVVFTLRILAEAQLAIEENPTHAQELAEKAEKHIELALNTLVFFIVFEFATVLTSLHILFEEDYWPVIGICLVVALASRSLMRRMTHI